MSSGSSPPDNLSELANTQLGVQLLAERFARWAVAFELRQAPQNVRQAAHRAILDTIGVCAAGSVHPKVQALWRQMADGAGQSHVIGQPGTMPAATAALINGMAGHVWDFDDTSYTGIMHGSTVILPAILAIAEDVNVDSEALLTAFIVGSEITYTLADVCTHHHYFKGWWSSATFGIIGAVAGVCRLMDLTAEQTVSAIGMAAAATGVGKAITGTDAKPFMAGETAQRAIAFARAAAAGLTGPADAFENTRGYLHLLNDGKFVMAQAETLGQRWRLCEPGLLFKCNPVCSAAQAAIELLANLMRQAGATADDIHTIRAEIPELVDISLVYPHPKTSQEAQFSLEYALACAALHGSVRLEDLDPAQVSAPEKRRIMAKITTSVSADLSSAEMRESAPESARLTVVLKDGRELNGECLQAYGMPERPLSDLELFEKFRRCLDFSGIPNQKFRFEITDYLQLVRDISHKQDI